MVQVIDIEEAVKRRFPEGVGLVVTKAHSGQVNMCPVGFFSLVAWEPKVWAVSIYREHFTHRVLMETEVFVLALPDISQVDDVLYCGRVHGDKVDKTEKTHFTWAKSQKIEVPVIEGAVANFECRVVGRVGVEDHTLFLGKVVAASGAETDWRTKVYNWDDVKLGTLELGKQSRALGYSAEGEE